MGPTSSTNPPATSIRHKWSINPFENPHAPIIAGWVQSDADLLWLAPRTQPPLTAQKIIAWSGPRNTNLLLFSNQHAHPVGYGELNRMKNDPHHYWLGHIIINPDFRRQGIGYVFVKELLTIAFKDHNARRVSLIVFPENESAVKCYKKAGFAPTRTESHTFRTNVAPCRMLRMDIDKPTR